MTLALLEDCVLARGITAAQAAFETLEPDQVASVDATLTLDFQEWFHYQGLQASMHAAGKLATADAALIHRALGGSYDPSNGGWDARVTTAEKYALTLAFEKLLTARIGIAKGGGI